MKKLVFATLFTLASAAVFAQGAKSDAPAATPATAATPADPGKGEGKALGHQKRGERGERGGKKKGHDKDRAKGQAEGHDDLHGKGHGNDMHGADAPAAEGKKPSGGKSK